MDILIILIVLRSLFIDLLHIKLRMGFTGKLHLSLTVVILLFSLTAAIFGPPARRCRSNRDCPGFRRTSCEGRRSFLLIFSTCARRRPYTVSGRCDRVPDISCNIANIFGGRRRCNSGSRCANCLRDQDCKGVNQYCSGGGCYTRYTNPSMGIY